MDVGIVLGLSAIFLVILVVFILNMRDLTAPKGLVLKMILSTIFVCMALYACRDDLSRSICIIIGLVLCWFGDYFLARFRMTYLCVWKYFVIGTSFFAAAQIFYIIYVSQHVGFFPFIALVLAMAITLAFVILNNETQSESGVARFTTIYTFLMGASISTALTAMFYADFAAGSIIFFIGMLLFFLSDAIIYGLVFEKYDYEKDVFNKSFYFIGQLLIVVSLFL